MEQLTTLTLSSDFWTRPDVLAVGLNDRDIVAALRSGRWVRIRHGAYAAADHWAGLDDIGRHRLRARAVLRATGEGVVLSHISAALEHGLAVWDAPLDRVHLTRLDGNSGGRMRDVTYHVGAVDDADLASVDGVPVVTPTRAAVETGLLVSSESALVTFDSLLHQGLDDHDGLRRRFESVSSWPGSRHLHIPTRMADAGSASAGESRGRWLFRVGGIPAPVTQFAVHDRDGVLVGTCDWGWPAYGLLGEFDGRIKYGRLLLPRQDPGAVVFAEKRREDAIRELTGMGMIRLVWDDLQRPRATVRRVEAMLRTAA